MCRLATGPAWPMKRPSTPHSPLRRSSLGVSSSPLLTRRVSKCAVPHRDPPSQRGLIHLLLRCLRHHVPIRVDPQPHLPQSRARLIPPPLPLLRCLHHHVPT